MHLKPIKQGFFLFEDLDFIQTTTIVRQCNDINYALLLARMRFGTLTQIDIYLLEFRCPQQSNPEYITIS